MPGAAGSCQTPAQARRLLLGRRSPGRHHRFIDDANDEPKPFVWTADPDKIIAAINRGQQVLDSIEEPL
jgi:hypothetical protein